MTKFLLLPTPGLIYHSSNIHLCWWPCKVCKTKWYWRNNTRIFSHFVNHWCVVRSNQINNWLLILWQLRSPQLFTSLFMWTRHGRNNLLRFSVSVRKAIYAHRCQDFFEVTKRLCNFLFQSLMRFPPTFARNKTASQLWMETIKESWIELNRFVLSPVRIVHLHRWKENLIKNQPYHFDSVYLSWFQN